jgi:hypothetical protein
MKYSLTHQKESRCPFDPLVLKKHKLYLIVLISSFVCVCDFVSALMYGIEIANNLSRMFI